MRIEELEARIRRLEDIEEIRKLKATYCYLCDAGLDEAGNREALLSHFVDDACIDFGLGPASVRSGKEGLRTFFGEVVPGAVSFSMHLLHDPIIEVDGDRATGMWYYEVPSTDTMSGRAQWMAGRYDEEYVRVDGRWKFASMKTQWSYITPYDEGWALNRGDLLSSAETD